MPKFLILYASEKSAEEQMSASPEDMKKGMQPWLDWYKIKDLQSSIKEIP